jgi:hypothetical protein
MYRMHRVFCATSWELEGERRAFYDLIGEFNQTTAMARGILYVPVSIINIRDKRPYQFTVDENIRDCRHYIVALKDDWGPVERNFRDDYRLAMACRADPQLPMEGVALLLKASPDGPPPIAAELEQGGIAPILFSDVATFRERAIDLLTGWAEVDAAAGTSS